MNTLYLCLLPDSLNWTEDTLNSKSEVKGGGIAVAVLGAIALVLGIMALSDARTVMHETDGLMMIGFAFLFFVASTVLGNQRKIWRTMQEPNAGESKKKETESTSPPSE